MCTYQCWPCYLPHSQLEAESEVSWSERTARSREALCGALLHVIQCVCQRAHRPEEYVYSMCVVSFWEAVSDSVSDSVRVWLFFFSKSLKGGLFGFLLREIQEHAAQCIHKEIPGNPMTSCCLLVLTLRLTEVSSRPHRSWIWQPCPQTLPRILKAFPTSTNRHLGFIWVEQKCECATGDELWLDHQTSSGGESHTGVRELFQLSTPPQ